MRARPLTTTGRVLGDLEPGARFRLPFSERTGTLLSANECRARVRLDSTEARTITAHAGTSEERTVTVADQRALDISPRCVVEVLGHGPKPGAVARRAS